MAETKREIERKYEAGTDVALPDLTRIAAVAAVVDRGVVELDATYYDTADLRLARSARTLRRRTGGDDEGWHLKLPVGDGVRDEIHAPLTTTVPRTLAGLVRSRTRTAELLPVVRLRSSRDVRHLMDGDGALLAEVAVDTVHAERLAPDGAGTATWTEIEVELADGGDPAFLDRVDKRLRKAGIVPAGSASKLARALAETEPRTKPGPERKSANKTKAEAKTKAKAKAKSKGGKAKSKKVAAEKAEAEPAATAVLAYLRTQRDALVDLDPDARRDLPDSVHQMRVATRRLRSALRSYGKILDRRITDPVGDELKWLAGELGIDRDREVLTERIREALTDLPRNLVTGPVRGRLRTWSAARRLGSRRHLIAVLDSRRHLDLLDTLDALLADPPLTDAAAQPAEPALTRAVRRDYQRLATLVEEALAAPPATQERDTALHEARKKAKRARYAAEAAAPALGRPARRLVTDLKALQTLLGEHQDSVMAREALRDLAAQAHAAGENSFTYGVLHGREERAAAAVEAELPGRWAAIGRALVV
ncbi:CHAD domain-containing protein [Streptomyces triticagri]|uniref:CHAD domain-containing protein n=1 Tax=Streptomyces triticagri TaxID=2293568 RepID=A0A372M7A9_9ACTN|nr:CYTH and CHAD domain-containing protein [Streptomyces triticagri]RFU86739.1 CHAD domain-containing protein [Streptomyces triticagri]